MRVGPARLLPAALFAAVALSALLPPLQSAAPPTRFSLAVLRRDGILIPFANYADKRWLSLWPAVNAQEVPIGLADVPKQWWLDKQVAKQWTAWPVSGPSRAITVEAPTMVMVHCARRVALRSDYLAAEAAPPATVQPYPKDGVAATPGVTIEPVVLVDPASAEAKMFIGGMTETINEAENKSVRQWSAWFKHPQTEAARAKQPVQIEVLAKSAGVAPGTIVYYFEGTKKYGGFPQMLPPDQAAKARSAVPTMCDYLTFAGGWLVTTNKAEMHKAMVGAELSNCNRQGLAYMLPLGVIRVDGKVFWITQTSGWDFERYDVIEIRQDDVRAAVSVGGGGCS